MKPELWILARPLQRAIAHVAGLGLLITVSYIAQSVVLANALAALIQHSAFSGVLITLIVLLSIVAMRTLLVFCHELAAGRAAQSVIEILRGRLLTKLIELGPGASLGRRTGEVQAAVVGGVEALETYYSQYLPSVFVALLGCSAVLLILAYLDVMTAVVLGAFVIAAPLVDYLWLRWRRPSSIGIFAAMGSFAAYLLDSLQGVLTLKAFGATQRRRAVLAESASVLRREAMSTLAVSLFRSGFTTAVALGGLATVIIMNSIRRGAGAIELSTLFVTLFLAREVFRPLEQLTKAVHAAWSAEAASGPVAEILRARALVADPAVPARAGAYSDVEFENVTFTYPQSNAPALKSVSFCVKAGQTVAIVGPSGAGKSTVAGLLQRFFDPAAGEIKVGAQDIRTLSLADLRQKIAIVSQETYLFHGTIAQNLRLARPGASMTEIRAAAKAANIEDFIESLPMGYETQVGERAAQLSGGQRQRLAIARALLKNAPILILDEATSSVDTANEKAIQASLEKLTSSRTTVVIAHRLSTIRNADRIIVLDEGQVIEQGTHRALLDAGGLYARLAHTQGEAA
jgi:ATP-binding cassette, subfamily C, bacterial CydD